MSPRSLSFFIKSIRSTLTLFLLFLSLTTLPSHSLAEADPPPPQKPAGVKITFIPPPIEGVINLGIYDRHGKLLRVLVREGSKNHFTIGLNGLTTFWDGKDSTGKALPTGTYSARGFVVGTLDVEGIAFHGNDWMLEEDSPPLRHIRSLELSSNRRLTLWAEGPDAQPRFVRADSAGEFLGEFPFDPDTPGLPTATPTDPAPPKIPSPYTAIRDGKVTLISPDQSRPLPLTDLINPIATSLGKDGRIWVVDQTPRTTEVKSFSPKGELLQQLPLDPADPLPIRIFASRTSELIFLIEQKPGVERVRALTPEPTPDPGKTASPDSLPPKWKTILSKNIFTSDTWPVASPLIHRPRPFKPEEKIRVRLVPNPLFQDASQDLDVQISVDQAGAFLRTVDGLPLCSLTENAFLKWAVMGREGGKAVTFFQSDGAVIEEFKIRKIANTMAFDAGDFQWNNKP